MPREGSPTSPRPSLRVEVEHVAPSRPPARFEFACQLGRGSLGLGKPPLESSHVGTGYGSVYATCVRGLRRPPSRTRATARIADRCGSRRPLTFCFHGTEWIPVCAGALGASFLFATWLAADPVILQATYAVRAAEALVGGLGFVLRALADWRRPAILLTDRFVFGAPAFAPLLLVDLALLGALGLWATSRTGDAESS